MKNSLFRTMLVLAVTGSLLVMQASVSSQAMPTSPADTTSQQQPPGQRILPQSAPDAKGARQSEIDQALFSSQEFFGSQATIAKPTREARENLAPLIESYPGDSQLRLLAAQLDVRLGHFDRAVDEMRQYAELDERRPRALQALAVFYNSRARFADEARTLMELARSSPERHRSAIYRRVVALLRDHRPEELDIDHIYQQMIRENAEDFYLVQNYIEDLRRHHRDDRALTVIGQARRRFPENRVLLKTEASIYLKRHRTDAALAVYDRDFKPLWSPSLAADYYALLKRVDRYRAYRRQLRQRVDAGTADLQAVARLFNLYVAEGNLAQANRVLEGFEKQRASSQSTGNPSQTVPPSDIETAGAMYASIGNYDQASRSYYTLTLLGAFDSDAALRERALERLFRVLMDAQNRPTRVAGGTLSLYKDIAAVDQAPGLLNGVLSLILADTDIPRQFEQREAMARRLFNSMLAHRIFLTFKADYPESEYLPDMYLSMIDTFVQFKRYALATDLGEQFLARYPNSSSFERVSLSIADAYRAVKNDSSERQIYQSLLERLAAKRPDGEPLMPITVSPWQYAPSPQWAAHPGRQRQQFRANRTSRHRWHASPSVVSFASPQEITYKAVLDRYIASLSSNHENQAILQLYWTEIKKHPRQEGLYEALLRWLERTNLFDQKLRAYQQAMRQFDADSWVHRLARLLIRQRRRQAFLQYSREIVATLDEEQVRDYLRQFIYNSTSGSRVNYDRHLYFELYRFAHHRFPHNLAFVRGLLSYYSATRNQAQWERLAQRYYFSDPRLRDELLRRWSQANRLRGRYQRAQQLASGSRAYRWFAADAAIWLCRYEAAVDAYRQLLELYPGDPTSAERLATLLGSLGQNDEKNFGRAAIVWSHLAEIYPTDHQYRTRAGEASADAGDLQAAGQQWDEIVALEPGRGETSLEVATIYWDYFMYQDAIRTIEQARAAMNHESLYAYQLGAVYEGNRDFQAAVREYVKLLADPTMQRATGVRRLAVLARRRGLKASIEQAHQSAVRAHPENPQLAIGYDEFLRRVGAVEEAWQFLERETRQRRQQAFLLYARHRFHLGQRFEAEALALRRLIDTTPTELDNMRYRLQLAWHYEQIDQGEQGAQIVHSLASEYPTNYGLLDEATRYLWRVGQYDQAIELYQTMIQRARGGYVRTFQLALAGRLSEIARFDEAEAVLRRLYDQNPTDTQTFGQLANLLRQAGHLDALLDLYRSGINTIAKLPLARQERRYRRAEIRRAMIGIYTQLGKHAEAVDQHIEIINRDAENRDVVSAAMNYARQYGMVDRLINYYQKTAEKSFRDTHWNQVLAWMFDDQGQVEKAVEQHALALRNEPQRLDVRMAYAEALMWLDRYEEAIAQFRRGYRLSAEAPEWMVKTAEAYARQGKTREAARALRSTLTSPRINSQNIFQHARLLETWGLTSEAQAFYLTGFERAMNDFYHQPLMNNAQLDGLVRTSVQAGAAGAILDRLLKARQWVKRETRRQNNLQAWRPSQFRHTLERALREGLARNLARFGRARNKVRVRDAILNRTGSVTNYRSESVGDLRLLASLAGNARLVDLEEQILRQLVDLAFRARTTSSDRSGYSELQNLIRFYDSRGAFALSIAALQHYAQRDPFRGQFTYWWYLGRRYRWLGDSEHELATLRQIYRSRSGALTEAQDPLLERYFSLLTQMGLGQELSTLAQAYSPFQLQLVNFLIAHDERKLAHLALEQTQRTPAWIDSRQAQVGYYFADTSMSVGADFRSSLRIEPIGTLIAQKPDPSLVLVGDDWYRTARVYGRWLDLEPAQETEAKNYAVALIENHPRRASDQLDLARYDLQKKSWSAALAQAKLAEELAPSNLQVIETIGEIQWAQGALQEAQTTWKRLVSEHPSSQAAHRAYLDILDRQGLKQQAVTPLQEFLVRAIDGSISYQSLVRRIVEVFQAPTAVELFTAVLAATPARVDLAQLLIEEELLPGQHLTPFYRAMATHFRPRHAAQTTTSEYWQRRWIEHLVEENKLTEAREEINAFRRLLGPSAPSPDWLTLNEAKIKLRLGQHRQAIEQLHQFAVKGTGARAALNKDRFLQAAALLRAEGLRREASELLSDMYWQLLTSGQTVNANFIGLAEALFDLARPQEALDVLRRLVSRAADADVALSLAAEVASRQRQFSRAVQYRSRLANIKPGAIDNRIALARAQAASGEPGAAMDTIVNLLEDRRTPAQSAAVAIELLPEIAADAPEQALAQLSAGSPRIMLARVPFLRRMGQYDQVRHIFESLSKDPYNVLLRIERALMEQQAGAVEKAFSAWEEALFLDPDQIIAHSIAFAAGSPRKRLIDLYTQANRYDAALQIVEGLSDWAPMMGDAFEPGAHASASLPAAHHHQTDAMGETIEQRNATARTEQRIEAFETLARAARALGHYDRALGYLRARLALQQDKTAMTATEQAIARLKAERKERHRQLAEKMSIKKNDVYLGAAR